RRRRYIARRRSTRSRTGAAYIPPSDGRLPPKRAQLLASDRGRSSLRKQQRKRACVVQLHLPSRGRLAVEIVGGRDRSPPDASGRLACSRAAALPAARGAYTFGYRVGGRVRRRRFTRRDGGFARESAASRRRSAAPPQCR